MHLLRTKSGVSPSRGTSDWRRYGASAAQIRLDYDSLRMNPFQPVIYPVYGNLAYFPSFFIHYVIHLMIVKWLFHEHKDAVF